MNMNTSQDKGLVQKHSIFSRDPAQLIQYVHKEVEVTCTDGCVHSGWVYTIDPVSQSCVLLRFDNQQKIIGLEVVLGHFIRNLNVVNDDIALHRSCMESLFKPADDASLRMSREETVTRRDEVKRLLLLSRVPVEICHDDPDVLSVGDVLFIHTPYSSNSCRSTNEIILSRIQALLDNQTSAASKDVA